MLALLFLYFIGKQFYTLAESFDKNGWGFALAGIAAYYAGTFVAGVFIGVADLLYGTGILDNPNDLVLTLIGLPFGLLACWALYTILKRSWQKRSTPLDPDILDEEI